MGRDTEASGRAPRQPSERRVVDTIQPTETDLVIPTGLTQGNERLPTLVVVQGEGLGAIHALRRDVLEIGREPGCAIVLHDVGVSRRHAAVWRQGSDVFIRDLGSKNGTQVQEARVGDAPRRLVDGDLVHVGQTTLKFLSDDSVERGYYERLHRHSMQDPLTELPNRRYFDEELSREIARSIRYGSSLVLLLCDLDHFKHVNDTYGHVVGDVVLREFAQLIRGRLRASEFFARYGGEEFAFVLKETGLKGAGIFAEVVRDRVAAHGFYAGERVVPVTVSLGGARWDSQTMSRPRDLVDAADANLYEAKRRGRNRVVLDDSPPPPPALDDL